VFCLDQKQQKSEDSGLMKQSLTELSLLLDKILLEIGCAVCLTTLLLNDKFAYSH
jgi:hypothetical protein